MEKFNNTTLFTGYLKQLLHNYNLPKYKVYTKDQQNWHDNRTTLVKQLEQEIRQLKQKIETATSEDLEKLTEQLTLKTNELNWAKNHTERKDVLQTVTKSTDTYPSNLHYIPYIKDGLIQEYIDDKWVRVGFRDNISGRHIHTYNENIKILNYTKNLKINNNIYDSYTHEYLGDYLRFQRDYNNINLMPLYNCFSDRPCNSLDISFGINGTKVIFNTKDTNYKIYMLPIKLFQNYTIAIDSETPIELCCGLYGNYQDERDRFIAIPSKTYQKFTSCKFNKPFLYTKLADFCNDSTLSARLLTELAQNESDFKLFIKVAQNNTSTITVLEGNYLSWTDSFSDSEAKIINNTAALNFEFLTPDADITLPTKLQLLSFNTGKQHPFADRLIEYLLDNVILPTDQTARNIKITQRVLEKSTEKTENYKYIPKNFGFWDNSMRYLIYDYMNHDINVEQAEANHDILGYVDKDVEKYYSYTDDEDQTVSLLNAELSEEDL